MNFKTWYVLTSTPSLKSGQNSLFNLVIGCCAFFAICFIAAVGLIYMYSQDVLTIGAVVIGLIIPAFIVLISALALFYATSQKRNEFTYYSEDAEKYAANLDVQLEKQYDLINSIAGLIKNYDIKEYDFIKDVTEARGKNLSLFEKSNNIDMALQRIYQITDHIPKMTATPMYTDLINEIKNEANDTAYAKKRYNQAVSSYNKRISMVPYSYFAKRWGFEKKPLFQSSYQSVQKHESKTRNEVYDSKNLFK